MAGHLHIEDKPARDRAKEAGLGGGAKRKAKGTSSNAKSPRRRCFPIPLKHVALSIFVLLMSLR
jgi:hypothetical protein